LISADDVPRSTETAIRNRIISPPTRFVSAERNSSATAAALRNSELSETSIAAAVCWSVWFGGLLLRQLPGCERHHDVTTDTLDPI
jgi:hypothetical protein